MKKDEILEVLKDQKEYIGKNFSVEKIGLFGSYAKDIQTQDSDIDIYVEFKNKTFDNIAGLWNHLESIYHKKIDMVYKHARSDSAIFQAIKKEVIYG